MNTRASRVYLLGVPAAAAAVMLWDPARHGGPGLCPFRAVTGIACPGCGLTRAAGALLRGRLGDALDLHPLALLLALQLAALWVLALVGLARRRPSPAPPAWVVPAVLAANAVLFAGLWGLRLAGGTLPPA